MSPSFGKKPISFGKYLLLDRVNIGGMAEVWRGKMVTDGGIERQVAIKRILPNIAEDRSFIAMFLDEARISVQLTHANVAQIYDLGERGGSYFIAMEYIAGKDVRAVFDRGRKQGEPAPIPLCCYIIAKAAEGLDHAHRKTDAAGQPMHIVHRDVSPQNVLLSFEGDVKVIDFGIAKVAGSMNHTQAGVLKGKFGYMSPEQGRGAVLDRRSDIFSLGICLYELLTGERLFVGESDMAVLEKVRKADVQPPSHYEPKIPDALDAIVLKALARDPSLRYSYASELADDLQRFLITSNTPVGRPELSQYMREAFSEDFEREKQRQAEYALIKPVREAPRQPLFAEHGMTDPGLSQASVTLIPDEESQTAGSLLAPKGVPELPPEVPTALTGPPTAEPNSETVEPTPEAVNLPRQRTANAVRWWAAGVALAALLFGAGVGLYLLQPRQGLLVLELPPGAWSKSTVSVEGQNQGPPRPVYAERVRAGVRRVVVTAPGFRPWSGTVTVLPGKEATVLHVPLEPLVEKGKVLVELLPETAGVFVGGVQVKAEGTRQRQLQMEAAVGQETLVEVAANGYRSFQTRVKPAAGQIAKVVARLEILTFGVTVRSDPPHARVLEEGQRIGRTPLNIRLPFGAHRLSVEKPCHVGAAVTVEPPIQLSDVKDVQVRLQPIAGCRP